MEIYTKEGDRLGVFFNEREIPGSDTEFLQEHRELPDRVRKSSNPEFPHTLILAIQSGLSILRNLLALLVMVLVSHWIYPQTLLTNNEKRYNNLSVVNCTYNV